MVRRWWPRWSPAEWPTVAVQSRPLWRDVYAAAFYPLLGGACVTILALATPGDAAATPVPSATSPQAVQGVLTAAGVGPTLLGTPALNVSRSELGRRSAASRLAYSGVDPSRALSLARDTFPGAVTRPAWRGLELRSGEKLVRYLSASTALVQATSGRRGVVVGTDPLVGTTPSGAHAPVNLSLQPVAAGSFAPVSADVLLRLPASANQPILLPTEGVSIRLKGATASSATPYAAQLAYISAYHDTDAFMQSVPSGLELSYQLRSANAPRQLSLSFSMKPGDVLRLVGSDDPLGGPLGSAEIDRGGTPLIQIAPASATDAAGQHVPVTYSLAGPTTLAIDLQAGPSTVWPVMVDPTLGVAGVSATSGAGCNPDPLTVGWIYGGSGGNLFPDKDASCNLFIKGGAAGTFYSANAYYEFAHLSPTSAAYIYRLDEYNASHFDYPWTTSTTFQGGLVATNAQPLPGFALLSYATKITDIPLTYSQNPFVGQILTFCVGAYGASTSCTPAAQNAPGEVGDVGFFELYANTSGIEYAPPNVGMGAETLYSSDAVMPTLTVTASTPSPSHWVQSGASGSVAFAASDQSTAGLGLGIASATLSGAGITDTTGGTAGLTMTKPCSPGFGGCATAATNPWAQAINYKTTAATPEGLTSINVTATSVSGIQTSAPVAIAVDNTAPAITVDGALTAPFVSDTTTDLAVHATDSSASHPTSGVASIEVLIDGVDPGGQYLYPAPACPAGSCDATNDFAITTSGLAPGPHTARVVARDFAGNPGTTDVPFTVSTTTPTISLSGPASSNGAWIGSVGPATVNLTATEPASGSGLQSATLTVDGGWTSSLTSDCEGDIEDTTCALTGTFDVRAAQLADGSHLIQLVVVDNAGNTAQSSWVVNFTSTPPQITATGPLADAAGNATPNATYPVHVAVAPGSGNAGVTSAAILVDGNGVASKQQACPGGGCALTLDYTYSPASFSPAAHTVDIYSFDAAGNVNMRSWQVNPQPTNPIKTGSCPSTATIQPAPVGATPLSAAAVLDLLTRTVPSVVADTLTGLVNGTTLAPALRPIAGGLIGDNQLSAAWMSASPGGAMAVGDPADPVCFTPAAVDAQASSPTPAGNAAAIVANMGPDTDQVTRAATLGLESVLNLRSNMAPQQFDWAVNLASGDTLQQLAPNLVAIVRAYPFDAASPDVVGSPDDGSPQPTSDAQAAAAAGDTTFPADPVLTFPPADPGPTPDTPSPGSAPYAIATIASATAQGSEASAELNSASERVDGRVRAIMVAPAAIDASGQAIPITLTAHDATITLAVPHTVNSAYPLTVDPVIAAPMATATALSSTTSKTVQGAFHEGPCMGLLGPLQYDGSALVEAGQVSIACKLGGLGDVATQFRDCVRINQSGTQKYADFHDWACVSAPDSIGQPVTFPPNVTLCAPGVRSYAERVTFKLHLGGPYPKEQVYRIQNSPARQINCSASALWKFIANAAGSPPKILRENLVGGVGFPDPLPLLLPPKSGPFAGFVAHHLVPTNDGRNAAAQDARARGWLCAIGGLAPAPNELNVPGNVPDPNANVNGRFTRGYQLAKKGDSATRIADAPGYMDLVTADNVRKTSYHLRQYDHTLHTARYYAAVAGALATVPTCTFPVNSGGSYRGAAQTALRSMVADPVTAGTMTH